MSETAVGEDVFGIWQEESEAEVIAMWDAVQFKFPMWPISQTWFLLSDRDVKTKKVIPRMYEEGQRSHKYEIIRLDFLWLY